VQECDRRAKELSGPRFLLELPLLHARAIVRKIARGNIGQPETERVLWMGPGREYPIRVYTSLFRLRSSH